MEEAKKVMVELPLTLIVSAFVAMAAAIVAMAVYFVADKKAHKKDAKESLTLMTDVLLKNSESSTALSISIDRSREQQERLSQETSRVLMSMTEKLIELKNGNHGKH